jgi:hypothetical protein
VKGGYIFGLYKVTRAVMGSVISYISYRLHIVPNSTGDGQSKIKTVPPDDVLLVKASFLRAIIED